MHERKLVQIGNSLGVTLPPDVIEALELVAGDWLRLEVEDNGIAIMITKSDLRERTKEHGDEIREHRKTLTARKIRKTQKK